MPEVRGTPCGKCGQPGGHHDGLCIRCKAVEIGEKCKKCGSPWVYIHAFMSEEKPRVPLCKPCCYAYIKLCGYLDDLPEVLARMRKEFETAKREAMKPEELEQVEPSKSGQEYLTF